MVMLLSDQVFDIDCLAPERAAFPSPPGRNASLDRLSLDGKIEIVSVCNGSCFFYPGSGKACFFSNLPSRLGLTFWVAFCIYDFGKSASC